MISCDREIDASKLSPGVRIVNFGSRTLHPPRSGTSENLLLSSHARLAPYYTFVNAITRLRLETRKITVIVIAPTIKLTISQPLSQAATTRILRLLPLLPPSSSSALLLPASPFAALPRVGSRVCRRASAIRMGFTAGVHCRALA